MSQNPTLSKFFVLAASSRGQLIKVDYEREQVRNVQLKTLRSIFDFIWLLLCPLCQVVCSYRLHEGPVTALAVHHNFIVSLHPFPPVGWCHGPYYLTVPHPICIR